MPEIGAAPALPPTPEMLSRSVIEPSSTLRPAREKAYQAMDALLVVGWPLTSNSAQRSALVSLPRF